jgi:1-acyl-sn-glycerol-3-phosphate acyltransferase
MTPSLSYRLSRALGSWVVLPWLRFKVAGRENVPLTGPVILVSNHQSYLDPMLLSCGSPRAPIEYMARDTLFRHPLAGFYFRHTHAFPVRRGGADRQAWKHFETLVKQGKQVSFFPEGTRSEDGSLLPVVPGSGMLIHRCPGAAVIPVRIRGSWKVLNKRRGFGGLHPVSVRFGQALDLSAEWAQEGSREVYQSIANKVMAAIAALPPVDGRDDDK